MQRKHENMPNRGTVSPKSIIFCTFPPYNSAGIWLGKYLCNFAVALHICTNNMKQSYIQRELSGIIE